MASPDDLLGNASKGPAPEAAPPMGRHSNEIDVVAGTVRQDLLGHRTVPHVGLRIQPFGRQSISDLGHVLFGPPDHLYFRLRRIFPRKDVRSTYPQE